ncbi:hypothetical protein LTR37_019912 [Vermiconidia calcicola]|uniref:Uncharacterized protein n=1 Tax=Vermiconidia calcicola TaxID=1690605 RepID=A0ACC3MEL8_9PEZI|nr:hypothetical protein LTR37_019912 [Vermiconidia calcicola]
MTRLGATFHTELLLTCGLLLACFTLLYFSRQVGKQKSQPPKSQPLKAADHVNDGKYHLLLAATGSVATIKIPNILTALSKYDNLSIRLLLSESAAKFLQAQSGEQPSLDQTAKIKNVDGIYRDADEWRKPWVRGDPILHIELRRWADMMVIAPLSANSLATLALGLSDNLISSAARAWDTHNMIDLARPGITLPCGGKKVIIVAPAMNTAMWAHPVTSKHLDVLSREWGVEYGGWFEVLWPIDKGLACGDTGSGAMREWKEIVAAIETKFGLDQSREEALIQVALVKIDRARARGSPMADFTQEEADALRRMKANEKRIKVDETAVAKRLR